MRWIRELLPIIRNKRSCFFTEYFKIKCGTGTRIDTADNFRKRSGFINVFEGHVAFFKARVFDSQWQLHSLNVAWLKRPSARLFLLFGVTMFWNLPTRKWKLKTRNEEAQLHFSVGWLRIQFVLFKLPHFSNISLLFECCHSGNMHEEHSPSTNYISNIPIYEAIRWMQFTFYFHVDFHLHSFVPYIWKKCYFFGSVESRVAAKTFYVC